MYEQFFGLSGPPFPSLPSAERFCETPPSQRALEILSRVVLRGEGPCLLLGPPGVGKSAVLEMLEQRLQDRYQVVRLTHNRVCTRRAFLQQLLYELGLAYQISDEGQLRITLAQFLHSTQECPHGVLLLVDDADAMPEKLFDELLMLCNIARHGAPLVHLVLAGGVQLEEKFATPAMASFQQRLAARVFLECLNRQETERYVANQLRAVGGDPALFTAEALRALREQSGGLPRVINQIANQSLILGAEQQAAAITVDEVLAAWAELQQLPAPAKTAESAPIEFGELDDDFDPDFSDEPPPSPARARREAPAAESPEEDDFANSALSDPEAALEALERRLAQAQWAENDADLTTSSGTEQWPPASPASAAAPPPAEETATEATPEAVFGWFETEEIVIDRFASLDFGDSIVGGYITTVPNQASGPWTAVKQMLEDSPDASRAQAAAAARYAADAATGAGRAASGRQDEALETDDAWANSWEATSLEPTSSVASAPAGPADDELAETAPGDSSPTVFLEQHRDDRDLIVVEDDTAQSDEQEAVRRYKALLEKMRRT